MIAMVISILVAVVGWIFYAKQTEKMAIERGIVTPDQVYKK